VVSKPTKAAGGVVQYDMGKETLNGFERTGTLNKPPAVLRAQGSERQVPTGLYCMPQYCNLLICGIL
jgi:hypothetical protein